MRRVLALAALTILLTWSFAPAAPLGADVAEPPSWPRGDGDESRIDTTAHGLRITGRDRIETAATAGLLLQERGDGPFDSPDPAAPFWGPGRCPFAVIVAASDLPADALAAASLSDPTTNSTEPSLTRSASADPFFDPVGEAGRVDTDAAPILLTPSTRTGARALAADTRATIAALANDAPGPGASSDCASLDSAIIVGGPEAVPAGVDEELVSLGLDQVFRVGGADRFATAAAIATALGTGPRVPSPQCFDDDPADGEVRAGWYGNAAVEFRPDASTCMVLGRSVVITDGVTGADALAAGWWTSHWQVPVLLLGPDGSLPGATADALKSLVIDNVIALGGPAVISDPALAEVARVASADTVRVAGADRYATSVEMARVLGGFVSAAEGGRPGGSLVCLAGSSGRGAAARGWPDALAAGPWCGAASGTGGDGVRRSPTSAPRRMLAPVEGAFLQVTRAVVPTRDLVPVLLTPVGTPRLGVAAADALAGAFGSTNICSSDRSPGTCVDPGFVVVFGGNAAVSPGAVEDASRLVSGSEAVDVSGRPRIQGAFVTELDLGASFGLGGDVTRPDVRACFERADLGSVRTVTVSPLADRAVLLATDHVATSGRYRADADGVARSPGHSAPICVGAITDGHTTAAVTALGVSGHALTVRSLSLLADDWLRMGGAVEQRGAEIAFGTDTGLDPDDGSTSTVRFDDADPEGIVVLDADGNSVVADAVSVVVTIVRGISALAPDRFTVDVTLETSGGRVVGSGSGEARRSAGTWDLSGRFGLDVGPGEGAGDAWLSRGGSGGFRATLTTNDTDSTDDVLRWRLDAALTMP